MANALDERFKKKTPYAARPEVREMSVGQRLTEFRSTKGKNRFGDSDVKTAPVVAQRPAVKRTSTGAIETPDITAARQRMQEDKRTQLAEQEKRSRYTMPDTSDCIAIFREFCLQNRDFYPSSFNTDNLRRALDYMVYEGVRPFTVAGLTECFQWLKAEGYLEPKARLRGQPFVPKEFPEYVAPEPLTLNVPLPQQSAVSAEELAALKSVPFDELQGAVRSQFKK